MIFLTFSKFVREAKGLPEIGFSTKNIDSINLNAKGMAEQVFHFENGKTVYWKNRYINPAEGYQFTDEERLVIVLKAVPL